MRECYMKYPIVFTSLIVFATPTFAQAPGMNCTLAEKELNLIKSQLDVAHEKFKMYVKQSVGSQVQAQPGKPLSINVDGNNDYVKAIAKLSVASATFSAVLDMCKEGSLKNVTNVPADKNADNYTATLIPKQ